MGFFLLKVKQYVTVCHPTKKIIITLSKIRWIFDWNESKYSITLESNVKKTSFILNKCKIQMCVCIYYQLQDKG